MTWDNFFVNFLANLAADIFVGAILGSLLTLWITRMLNNSEWKRQQLAAQISDLTRAIKFLKMIREEYQYLETEFASAKDMRNYFHIISTSTWQAIESTGELPKLLEPQALGQIAGYYELINLFREARNFYFEAIINKSPSDFVGTMLNKASYCEELIRSSHKGTTNAIDSEIKRLESDFAKLTK